MPDRLCPFCCCWYWGDFKSHKPNCSQMIEPVGVRVSVDREAIRTRWAGDVKPVVPGCTCFSCVAQTDIAALLAALEEVEAALAADQRRTAAVLDVAEERIAEAEAERDRLVERGWKMGAQERDALRARLSDLVDVAEGLADQQAMPDDSYRPALDALRAFLADGPEATDD